MLNRLKTPGTFPPDMPTLREEALIINHSASLEERPNSPQEHCFAECNVFAKMRLKK